MNGYFCENERIKVFDEVFISTKFFTADHAFCQKVPINEDMTFHRTRRLGQESNIDNTGTSIKKNCIRKFKRKIILKGKYMGKEKCKSWIQAVRL